MSPGLPPSDGEPGGRVPGTAQRAVLIVAGSVAVGLSVLGAILPLLPTTPFVLVAGVCFARSWPSADRWLNRHAVFGPLRSLGGDQPHLTRRAKAWSLSIITISFGCTLGFAPMPTSVRIGVAVLGVLVFAFVAKQPTRRLTESRPEPRRAQSSRSAPEDASSRG